MARDDGHSLVGTAAAEAAVDAIIALGRRAPVSAGKVKALPFEGRYGFWRAGDGIGGFFEVTEAGGAFHLCRIVHGHANKLIPYRSRETALAACQVEHDRRILAQIQPGDGWQGIDTMPDEIEVLVWAPGWDIPSIAITTEGVGPYDPISGGDFEPAPTHWMPLPGPAHDRSRCHNWGRKGQRLQQS